MEYWKMKVLGVEATVPKVGTNEGDTMLPAYPASVLDAVARVMAMAGVNMLAENTDRGE